MIEKIIDRHYKFIGNQNGENGRPEFGLYNCTHCKTTISDKNLISLYKSCGIMYDAFDETLMGVKIIKLYDTPDFSGEYKDKFKVRR